MLFKRFADIDVFDIEVSPSSAEEMVQFGKMIAPTFGGINLEDIKAPECFYIERELQKLCDIPVFHDGPARDGDYFRRGADQRAGGGGQKD